MYISVCLKMEEIAVRKYLPLMIIMVAISAVCVVLKRRRGATRRKWWIRPVNKNRNVKGFHLSLFRELKITDHEEFFSYTRMLPHQFNDLLRQIEPFLPPGGLRRSLPSELKLALIIGFLAHGDSARSKSWEFRIGRSTVYKVIREVCEAIWKALQPIVLPQPDELIWKQSAEGSISDGGVWSETKLGRCVTEGTLDISPPCELPDTNIKINHVLLADEAFPLNMNLIKPYSQKFLANAGADADKARVFNYRLSRARRTIENAFGILASRWQILLKGCSFHPENVDHII